MQQYQPKGGMCATCSHWDQDCSKLPFKDMPAIGRIAGVIIVKCTSWISKKYNLAPEFRGHE